MRESILLPLALSEAAAPLERLARASEIEFVVPDDYEQSILSAEAEGEVFAIQRLLAVARLKVPIRVNWASNIAKKFADLVRLQPLISVLSLLENVKHEVSGDSTANFVDQVKLAQQGVTKHRLKSDLFSPSQMLVCADSLGYGRPDQLYLPNAGVRPRSHFETLVEGVLTVELNATGDAAKQFRWTNSLGVIVGELFENTDIHGTKAIDGSQLGLNAIRGVIFKRIGINLEVRRQGHKAQQVSRDCLEISVFDSGVGYFQSFTRQTEPPSIEDEWKVLHKCLERHYDDSIPDGRPAHRALGLAEVLKKLMALEGRIEIRTGRTFGYRTFIEGQTQVQMQPMDTPGQRFSWPKPSLLDFKKQFVGIPTAHERTVGTAVRVIVPLS
jgi:hypothetical protein